MNFLFKAIEVLYVYSQDEKITMKQVQEDLLSFLAKGSEMEWNITNLLLEYWEKRTGHLNYDAEKPIYIMDDNFENKTTRKRRSVPPPPLPPKPGSGYDEKWSYIKPLMNIYGTLVGRPQEFSWSMKNVGTTLVKMVLLYNRYYKYDQKVVSALNQLFTIQGQNMTLPDISYLYSLIDFRAILENQLKYKNEWFKKSYSGYPFEYPSIYGSDLETRKSIFVNCFKSISDELSKKIKVNNFENINFSQNHTPILPCMDPNEHSACAEYCNWHNNYFKKLPAMKDFMTIMGYALPQRKLLLESKKPNEKELAEKLFGINNVKDMEQISAPKSMAIFCHGITTGYEGDDFGDSVRFCNDFFPTPTDKGICMTKHLNVKEILNTNKDSEEIYEPQFQWSSKKFKNGIDWDELTLVILPDSQEFFGQSYPRKPDSNLDRIQFQLHESKELANMIFNLDDAYSDNLTSPIILKGGNEYYIKVGITGSISTDQFR